MSLPKKISPNPLVTSSIELRFSKKTDEPLLPKIYSKYSGILPILEPINTFPKEIKEKNEDLRYYPDYKLRNENFSLSFSKESILFENVSDYKLWGNFFPFIKESLLKFFDLDIIEKVHRIGVRYASVFDQRDEITEVIQFALVPHVEGYAHRFGIMRFDLIKEDLNFHVQFANNAKSIKENRVFFGVYIDIDTSLTKELTPSEEILQQIDRLHQEGKFLFFEKIIKPEFLDSLNPEY